MKKQVSRGFGAILSAAMLLSLAACGNTTTPSGTVNEDAVMNNVNTNVNEVATATTQVEINETIATIGQEVSCSGVEATVNHAYLCPTIGTAGDSEFEMIFYEITVTNNSDSALCMNYLTDTFFTFADDDYYPTENLRAGRMLMKEFGEGVEYFSTNVEAGETRTGYVYAEAPVGFENVALTYFPADGLGEHETQFTFNFTREELETAPEPVLGFDE